MDNNIQQNLLTLKAIFESLEIAVVAYDLNHNILQWNPAAKALFGFEANEILGKSISRLIPEAYHTEQNELFSRILRGEHIAHLRTVSQTKSGSQFPVSLTISPIKDERGNIIGASQIIRDISLDKEAEAKQAMLAAIVESSDDAIISKDLNGFILSWNSGAEKIFGYHESEVIGKHITILIPEYRLDEENDIISSIRRGEKVDHFQTKRLTKTGREIDISLTVSPIKDQDGKVIGASKVARDITRQKETEEALLRNNRKLNILNEVGRSISEKLDVKAILQKVTDATTQITGADFGAFFYNTINDDGEAFMLYTLSGAPREKFDKFGMPRNTAVFHTTFAGTGVVRVDDITKDPRYGQNAPHFGMPKGHLPVVSYLAVPVKLASGEVIGGLFFGHKEPGMFLPEHEDLIVTLASQAAIALDNSRLFEEVKDLSQKKDEFIALASHELKTPLTSLSGFLQIIERTANEDPAKLFAGRSIKTLEKLNVLIADLFDISKVQAGKLEFHFERIDLAGLLKEIIETARLSQKTHKINFTGPGPVFINGDRMRLEQVIFNLINNAVKYSPEADKIDIRIENNSDKVIVFIKDYGMGISKENQTRIFSQFYRVDGLSHKISGLGLGLYISKEIIERHGGRIMVESELGKGAVFSFEVPLVQD